MRPSLWLTLFALAWSVAATAYADAIHWSGTGEKPGSKVCSVSVDIRHLKVAHIADLDILIDQIKKRAKRYLLLGVENMNGGASVRSYARIYSADLQAEDKPITFQLPCAGELRVLALSICSDDEYTGRCLGKTPALMNSLAPSELPLSDTKDRVYFFGIFFMRQGAVGTLPSIEKGRYGELKNTLISEGKLSAAEAEKIGSTAAALNDSIASYPLQVENGGLVLLLPRTAFRFSGNKYVPEKGPTVGATP